MTKARELTKRAMATLACAALACAALGLANAHAGLTSTINLDSPTQLDVLWRWSPEEPDIDTPALTNWFAQVAISAPVSDQWRLQAEFRHATDPHPPLGESGGGQTYYVGLPPYDYLDPSGFGVLFDDPSLYAYHSPVIRVHTDVYHFTVDRRLDPADTQIRLIGTHVPRLISEPSMLGLVGLSFAGLLIQVGSCRERTRSRCPRRPAGFVRS